MTLMGHGVPLSQPLKILILEVCPAGGAGRLCEGGEAAGWGS